MTAAVMIQSLTKTFAGVTALSDVSFSIARGECHALMGENGAGKSTLGKVLAGIHRPDAGRVIIDGKPMDFRSPSDAQKRKQPESKTPAVSVRLPRSRD